MFLWNVTRGEVLRYRIAFALSRASKIVRGLGQDLNEGDGYTVADHVVRQLKEHGDPWRLNDAANGEAALNMNHKAHFAAAAA
jgi:hypothetical protein